MEHPSRLRVVGAGRFLRVRKTRPNKKTRKRNQGAHVKKAPPGLAGNTPRSEQGKLAAPVAQAPRAGGRSGNHLKALQPEKNAHPVKTLPSPT